MTTPDVDPALCPLCGAPNACTMAPGGDASAACWCTQQVFAPELLARVPAEQQGQACICRRCAQLAAGAAAPRA